MVKQVHHGSNYRLELSLRAGFGPVMNYGPVNFGPVTDGQTDRRTESDAYEPTVHKHRCAQKIAS